MKLTQIRGQAHIVSILSQAIKNNRLAHAYLFSGPDGVGKKTTALALAKALNCLNRTGAACLKCTSCHKLDQAQHPDVRLLSAEGNYIKIESIRSLQQRLAVKPYEGSLKIEIIDEADKLTTQAANCLLKTLEEPPANSLIILVSAQPYNLPLTVRSRCQHLTFNQLAEDEIVELLKDKGFTTAQCRLIAFFCQGSLAQALRSDLEQILSERTLLLKEMIEVFPLSAEALLSWAQTLSGNDEQTERTLKWLQLWYRDLLIIRRKAEHSRLVNEDKRSTLNRQAAQFGTNDLYKMLKAIERTRELLARNVNSQLALEVLLMDLNQGYNLRNDHEIAA
jgi:DNA polymerase-3 subunit delta'